MTEWAVEHLGYTAWVAHALALPPRSADRAVRTYVVDIHAGADAVNPRVWPPISPFLALEVFAAHPEAGCRRLAELFRARAAELALPPAAEYLVLVPPSEPDTSSPVDAALDSAMPLDLDHPQEDIDIMNEGLRGRRLATAL